MVSYYDRNVVFHVDKISTYNPALIYVYISSCQSTGRHITAFFALKPIQLNYYVVLLAVELQKVSAYIHPGVDIVVANGPTHKKRVWCTFLIILL